MPIGGAALDVSGIVGQLMTIEQRPIAALNKKEAAYQAKISAYGGISGALSGFQTAVQDLSKPDKFKTIKATSSEPAALTTQASDKASTGTHTIAVTALAQAQKLVGAGKTSDTANIGTGAASKITFDFGNISGGTFDTETGTYKDAAFTSNAQGIKTITIDASNNTLQGIRDSINAAKLGIKASIINDGSDYPYTLTLSPENIGSSNSIKISVTGDDEIADLLAHDPAATQNLTQTVAAQNSSINVDGVTVSKASNTIAEVIPGVTMDLLKITDKPVTITIANDGSIITSAVQGFVKSFNDLNKTLQDLSAYNPATKQGAILQGDSTVRLLQSQIRAILNTPISNTGGSITTLSQIGVTIQKDGAMALDTSKLDAAIKNNPTDVASLFTTIGKSSNSNISYSSAMPNTNAGSYPVKVTQMATHGTLSSREELESLIIDEGDNDQLNVTINGVSSSVELAAGQYSFDGLANEIQAKINGAEKLVAAGITVSVKHGESGMIITSNAYGSKSTVEASGSAALNLFGKKPERTTGLDVAGTINGTEAKGSAQMLTAKDGVASGIKVNINGGAVGERGQLNYSQGYAHKLNTLISAVLAKDGQIESKKHGLNSSIKDVANRRDKVEQGLPLQEARFRKQYSTLETTLSNMSKTSNYLSQQLSNLPRPY